MSTRLPYVSHIVLNAGVASFHTINFWQCITQLFTRPMAAITSPEFYSQHSGEISADNLGWIWQSNVFGHFVLVCCVSNWPRPTLLMTIQFRELEELLAKSPFECSRVIWCSSLEASPRFYDSEDWQLIKTSHSYESSKYEIDLISTTLDQVARQSTKLTKPIRHFVTEPGVCSTSISANLVGPFLDMIKVFTFYLVRAFDYPCVNPFAQFYR